jgi:hypothetical protein
LREKEGGEEIIVVRREGEFAAGEVGRRGLEGLGGSEKLLAEGLHFRARQSRGDALGELGGRLGEEGEEAEFIAGGGRGESLGPTFEISGIGRGAGLAETEGGGMQLGQGLAFAAGGGSFAGEGIEGSGEAVGAGLPEGTGKSKGTGRKLGGPGLKPLLEALVGGGEVFGVGVGESGLAQADAMLEIGGHLIKIAGGFGEAAVEVMDFREGIESIGVVGGEAAVLFESGDGLRKLALTGVGIAELVEPVGALGIEAGEGGEVGGGKSPLALIEGESREVSKE